MQSRTVLVAAAIIAVCTFSQAIAGRTTLTVNGRGAATLAGTLAISGSDLAPHKEPIPWIHFHGTDDPVIGIDSTTAKGGFQIQTVAQTIDRVKARNNATETELQETIDTTNDGTSAIVSRWAPKSGSSGERVAYVKVIDGGHTWPGHAPPARFVELLGGGLGKYTKDQ